MSRRLATAGRSVIPDIDKLDNASEVTLGLCSVCCVTAAIICVAMPAFSVGMMPWIWTWEGPPPNTTTTSSTSTTTMSTTLSQRIVASTKATTVTTTPMSNAPINMFGFKSKMACRFEGTVQFDLSVENVDLRKAPLQTIVSFKTKLQQGIAAAAGHSTKETNVMLSSFSPQAGHVKASIILQAPNGGLEVSSRQLANYFSLAEDNKVAHLAANKAIVADLMGAENIKTHCNGVISVSWSDVHVSDAFSQMDDVHEVNTAAANEDKLHCKASFPMGCAADWSHYVKDWCCHYQGLCCEGFQPPEIQTVQGADGILTRSEFDAGMAGLPDKCQMTNKQINYVWDGLDPNEKGEVTREGWNHHMDVCRKFYCVKPNTTTTTTTLPSKNPAGPKAPSQPTTTTKATTTEDSGISQGEFEEGLADWDGNAEEACTDKLDLTGDGIIDKDEFAVAAIKAANIEDDHVDTQDADALFNHMDHNHDGKVEMDECFVTLKWFFKEMHAKGKKDHIFVNSDHNMDGELSMREFGEIAKYFKEHLGKVEMKDLFKSVDEDHNGEVDVKELGTGETLHTEPIATPAAAEAALTKASHPEDANAGMKQAEREVKASTEPKAKAPPAKAPPAKAPPAKAPPAKAPPAKEAPPAKATSRRLADAVVV
eukprot:TRINITY_DN24435_c0_g2_i1.p1 TRINITY_DN24435_c0_g2~~TRINITY_DN24435_c0_g2_i1.p1  ORF type:complete len:653 (+),score=189.57 TRINITY_DN24435_c0_g2_i1:151-2109(+)